MNPPTKNSSNHKLLTKPCRDHLVGLQRKVDRLNGDRITQSMADCIQFLLIETARIDQEAL